ncbi:transcription-associated protein 1 [Coemansia spiralis]|uniref:Transcription-associated protein 1 n=1 Tax=Coemansia spiralis TaxID=417178 RepID=A0A9W8L1U3_9FUNG|nr:transcription-associated protein 1 [Coemansia spiralis]
MAITNFEVYATRLRDERLDVKLKQTIAHELCESLEAFQPQDYSRFVSILWPVIRDILLKTPPVFVGSAPEQKLRSTILEIIQRIPHSEVFRPIVLEVVTTLLSLVKIENEDNAVLCLKIIYELHRVYRQLLESVAAPFLELAAEIYRNADQMLKAMDSMDTPAPHPTPNANLLSPSAMSPGPDVGDMSNKNLGRATTSFKVMTEIPIIVVSVIQANRRHADPFVTGILPLILHMLELNPRSAAASYESASQHWRSAHVDLITAQSKTLSFLAFFARGFTTLLLPCQARIAQLTLQLLCSCPAEATATRKEMLIATRHIVSTEIRKAFVPIADKFLDMQVLVGSGLASQCILKPFAFSMLADLMHHIRSELSPSQLSRMVDFYAGCMHDQQLSSGVHTMCAKLLHNITECIMHIPSKQHGRVLLLAILKTFASSFSAIGDQAVAAIADIKSGGVYAEEKLYGANELIRTNTFEQGDKIKELRFLLRSLVTGCKNVIYALRKCDSVLALGMGPRPAPILRPDAGTASTLAGAQSLVADHEAELAGFELELLTSLFREGLRACRIHDVERIRAEHAIDGVSQGDGGGASEQAAEVSNDGSTLAVPAAAATPTPLAPSREAQIKLVDREGKEQIEHFANLFVNLDPAVFHELFTSQFDYAFHAMIDHCAAISSVQVFVAFDATSPAFISIMLRYMCDRLELLGSDDEALTGTMLHLFKIAFLALAFFPEANEPVLQPYIQTIINSALTISKSAKKPENYFLLLRALFRSIGGGRYESLYKEVFPVLQNLLETLNSALGFTKRASPMQELFVEICLTVPVRLSVLLPYLSLLMKPLVFALESGPELVSQGLRTLELCIDNLTREFLDPILTPVMDEIMSSLWVHLRLPSSASSQASVAARILGKLGGRNRHMLLTRFPSDAEGHAAPGEGCFSVPLTFEGLPGLVSMPLGDAVAFSITVLEDHAPSKRLELARKDTVDFVVACARYTLVLPFVGELPLRRDQAAVAVCGQRLADLASDPLLLKRLANIASPSSQGCLTLERIISACPSVGDSFKGSPDAPNSDASLFAATSATSMGSTSLAEVYSSFYPPGKAMSISHDGLMKVLWALSLACSDSDVARGLLQTIISLGAQQHIAQCVDLVSPEPLRLDGSQLCPTALAIAVPDAISRALVSHSDRLRSTGCLMLRFFYTALRDLLPDKESLVGQLPAMRSIVSDLCAACYDPNIETKISGCTGITYLIQDLHLGRAWLADNLLELSKALLFTLKDAHLNAIQSAEPAHSRETLLEIIRQAFPAAMFAPTEIDADIRMATDDDDSPEGTAAAAALDTSHDATSSECVDVKAASISLVGDSMLADAAAVVNDDVDTSTNNGLHDAVSLGIDAGSGAVGDSTGDILIDEDPAEQTTSIATPGVLAPVSAMGDIGAAGNVSAGSDASFVEPASEPFDDDGGAADLRAEQLLADSMVKSSADAATDAALDCVDVVVSSAASDGAASPIAARPPSIGTTTAQAMDAFQRFTERLTADNVRLIKSFLALITKELANPSTEVREAAKACLDILVGVTGCSVTALLLPSRDRLLVPIFGKPLRALPHNMQIGNIDAITYCLSLDPPFLEINEELLRLLSEALALADAEDQALVNHPAQVRSNTASLTHLRHVCIRMLTAAMVRPEFADAKNTPTRARIISVFFKSLYHKSVEVVDAANDGLKQVLLQQQKLPRDLLQTGLRPILMNLSDYKRLTVASLDGLARLLQLLTNYFKVEVGRKLLDHMQQWANPQLLQAALEKSIEDMHEIKILVAILQVFHLLPSSANVLLDDLVSSVVNLEVHLCRRESSPFRKPLFKFLNRYPAESAVYFIERIESTHFARIFTHAISCPESGPLREALVNHTPMLVNLLNGLSEQPSTDTAMAVDEEKADAVIQAHKQTAEEAQDSSGVVYKRLYIAMSVVSLIHTCMEYTPLWLEERSDLLAALLGAWSTANGLTVMADQVSRLAKPVLIEHLVRSLLLATRAMSNPPSILFKLLEISGSSSDAIDVSFVFQYVWTELITKWSIAKRREILSAFLLRLGDSSISDEANSTLLQHLINPMVATVFTLPSIAAHDGSDSDASHAGGSMSQEQRSAELLRGQIISLIHQRVWVMHMSSSAQTMAATKASVRLELVQLSSILMRHAVSAVADLRKDIIKFGWIFIRNDDIMIKNASYVLVSQFIAAFDTPPKITLQAYSSLLKAHQVESRFLVRQALDILLPVLPLRLGQSAASSSSADASGTSTTGLPAWVVLAKRVLIDHSSSLALTTHVYQLIAGHAAIFFPYRMHFASNLVGVLQRMCLTHNSTSETRTLALDIMDLLLKWHEMLEPASVITGSGSAPNTASAPALESEAVGGMTEDASSSGPIAATATDLLTEARRETIVGLLLRMLCLAFDFVLKSNLGPRALGLLTRYLDTTKWPPMHLRLTFFERSVQQIESQGMNQQLVLHILTVLSAVTAQMQAVWFEEYYGTLVSIIRKCIVVDNGQVQKLVASMLRQLYEQAANNERLDNSPVVSELRTHTEALIGKNLQDGTNIFGTLLILDAVGEYTGDQFNSYTPHLMKLVLRCIKDHNSHAAAASLGSPASSAPTQPALQSSSSSISVATLASDSASASTPRAANSAADIISLVSSNSHIPLTVDAIVKGETPLDILLMLLILLRSNISRLGDQRRSFLTHIIQLIERSSDPALLHVVLAIVRGWVLDTQDMFPTIKEKAMLMSSMMSFVNGSASANENASRAGARASVAASAMPARSAGGSSDRPMGVVSSATGHVDPFALLERRYLTLVLEVYNDPRFTRSEMTMRLEQAFLSGMQSEDSEMRGLFLETFDANMPPSLPVRLNYLLETQNWDSVSSTFWLQQCLPLLFASTHQRASLRSFVSSRLAGNAAAAADRPAVGGGPGAVRSGVASSADMDVDVDGDYKPPLNGSGPHTSSQPCVGESRRGDDALDSGLPDPCSSDARANGPSIFSSSARAWDARTQVTVGDVVGPLARMVLLDTRFAYRTWTLLLPLLWQNLGSKERHDLTSGLTRLLAKPYHQSQTSLRPNVIQAILDALSVCVPPPRLPPQLLRYLGQTYGAWYSALTLLEQKILDRREVESAIFDRAMGVELGAFDALTELYTSLSAHHYFYGAWKRHCQYKESHIALAYEQLGDWANAQSAYERAQSKARAGTLQFSESEYYLWESRWAETAKRLQNWDSLLELGLRESLPEIELESGWRSWDWSERQTQVRQLIKATTSEFASSPRAKFYETFLALSKGGAERSKTADFQRMCKEGIKSCLQHWSELPPVGTPAHIGMLHMFQLMVELGDASNIYSSLASTKVDNLETKSGDLKSVLQTWRERLPNPSDPINIWSDLVAWRQHVFKAINDVYVPFITQQSASTAEEGTNGSSSLGTDGSTKLGTKTKAGNKGSDTKGGRKANINGVAADGGDAARPDSEAPKAATPSSGGASNSVLTSYAYRGYHEMAWIINRFAHIARLHGLVDVCINSLTRIYTLPNIEIQEAFLKLREQAKCYYHRPQELQSGLDVISNTNLVYFTPAQKAEFFTLKGQFLAKLGKLEEANHAFATGIQLDLGSPKAWAAWGRYNDERFCSNMPDTTGAVNAISCYMQAAGLSKRPRVRRYLARTLWLLSQDDASGNVCAAFDTYKSEMPTWYWIAFIPQLLAGLDAPYSRQVQQILLRIAKQYPQALYYGLRTAREESQVARRRQTLGPSQAPLNSTPPSTAADAVSSPTPGLSGGAVAPAIEDLMPKLKTAHPLLALSMETMIDQIVHRLKPCPEEDIYRLVHTLLLDGLQQLHLHVSQGRFDLGLVDTIVSNTCRVALGLPSGAIKARFELDFGRVREMDLCEYVTKLYQWQQMLRQVIKRRPTKLMLSLFSPFLVEFEQQKFEDVEVPGQYLQLSDSNDDFVRIERFLPELSIVLRSNGVSRNLAIRGGDGSIVHFAVQHSTSRHYHQEERWVQLYRNLDAASEQGRDTWEQHRLAFHLPTIVSLAPHIRLVQEQPNTFMLQDVYDSACARSGNAEIAPVLYFVRQMRSLASQLSSVEEANLVLFEQICQRLVPASLLSDDVRLHAASPMDYWLYRENFSYQVSVGIALAYMIASTQRTPAKLGISRTTGNLFLSDMVPTQATPGLMHSKEPVPFRLTPNIQVFVTELGLEGIVPLAIYKVMLRFTEIEHLLRDFLDLYVRDELISMPTVKPLAAANPLALAEMCERNVRLIVHRAGQLAETLPAKDVQEKDLSPMQPLIQLLGQAVAPSNLSKMDFTWMPWL